MLAINVFCIEFKVLLEGVLKERGMYLFLTRILIWSIE
jgi:hypothetical protein